MNVADMLDWLEGHDWDREIKIKLHDGSIKEVEGVQFRNVCVGGDDIIYIVEKNPLREKYRQSISELVEFVEQVFEVCEHEDAKGKKRYGDDFDNYHILGAYFYLCREMDFYIEKCNLQKKIEERFGRYDPGCGETDEAYTKLEVLKDFISL